MTMTGAGFPDGSGGFPEDFLRQCSLRELVELQHELRKCPEDAPWLQQVLREFRNRAMLKPEIIDESGSTKGKIV